MPLHEAIAIDIPKLNLPPAQLEDAPNSESLFYSNSKESEEITLLRILNHLEYEKLQNEIQNREDRKKYASHIFVLILHWITAIFLLVFLVGFGEKIGFILSDKVMMAMIGGTTANILGVFVIVAKYLFNSSGASSNKTKKQSNPNKVKKKGPGKKKLAKPD